MSRAGLSRLWTTLGFVLAIYATGTWITLQGGKSFVEVPGLEAKSPVTGAYLAVIVIGALLGILAAVGLFYLRTGRKSGEAVLPIVFVADVGPHRMASLSMTLYQGFFVALFMFLPAISLIQLNFAVLQRGVLWHQGDPAMGSIALKNALTMTSRGGAIDRDEALCASTVTRDGGFTWLANMRCDLAKDKDLGPFHKGGKSLVDDAEAAPVQSCIRRLAMLQSGPQACEGTRDISEECEVSERHCRGIQWFPVLSPVLLASATCFGWVLFAWLLVEAASTWRTARREEAAGRPDRREPGDTTIGEFGIT